MKLSTKSRYGLRALFDIAYNAAGQPAQIQDISRRQDISPRYLEQIFQGYYAAQSRQANFGLESRGKGVVAARASTGFIIDPPDGLLPTQPWAHALQQDRLRIERAYDDPAAHCFPTGSPRAMNINDTYFLQTPGYVVILIERMSYRIVRLGGHHPPDNVRLWQGDSIGRWEGDTLIVDCAGRKKGECSFDGSCVTQTVWEESNTLLNQFFESITLKTLCERGESLGIKREQDHRFMYFI